MHACYRLVPPTHRSPSASRCRSLCQKWQFFFVEPEVQSQWTVLVGYLTISTKYVSCYHVLHILTSQKKEQHQHQRKIISFLLSYGPNITHLLLVT